ncbi:fungal-specific transcription factor domain-containing protein [Phyllosticta capitalensis]|uniref:Fungal-specific transcription factor domain-containing protein n=1 Tax=Phyllosticta capitalensis TaxID=121624 RepID=A0ABR1YJF5_9PEZI
MGVVTAQPPSAAAAAAVDVSSTTAPSGSGGKENPRKRPKSKNGCQRCKLKRLKCDETKPSCRNCVARHIDCPGYGKLLKWCDKYQSYLAGERPGRSQVQSQTLAARRRDSGRSTPLTTRAKRKEDADEGRDRRREEAESVEEEGSASSGWNQAVGMHLRRVVECVAPVDGAKDRPGEARSRGDEETSIQEVDRGPDSHGGDSHADDAPNDMPTPGMLDIDLDAGFTDLDIPEMGFQTPSSGADGIDDPGDVEELPLHFNDQPEEMISFYTRANSAPGPSLVDPAMKLVNYYFSNVCPLYSAFDSALNPFRSAVGQIWDSSQSVYYAIQSMAAAQLANFYPEMIFTGLEMQRKAYQSLQDEMQLVTAGCQSSDRALLTLLLLGPSASWHDSSDLGLSHLSAARALIYPRLIAPVPPGNNLLRRRNQFFEEALIYWEMLIGFVEPECTSSNIGPLGLASSFLGGNSDSPTAQARKLLPHPWTGIAPKVQTIFAEVGRLIRQERLSKSRDRANSRAKAAADNLAWATVLEDHLLSASLPTTEDLIDPGDVNTTRADFVAIGEAYRCAGLLELYRVFPSLLRKRSLGISGHPTAHSSAAPPPTASQTSATDARSFLNSLALHILSMLESLPSSSGTMSTQPILLVAAASELRHVTSLDYWDFDAGAAAVRHARRFVMERLREFSKRLPRRPLERMMELVEEVWRRGGDTFWVDVMLEKGWQTVMG